jgi:O-antigen/teichoic acid export membrane protein
MFIEKVANILIKEIKCLFSKNSNNDPKTNVGKFNIVILLLFFIWIVLLAVLCLFPNAIEHCFGNIEMTHENRTPPILFISLIMLFIIIIGSPVWIMLMEKESHVDTKARRLMAKSKTNKR